MSSPSLDPARLCVVTVTYGDRLALLKNMVLSVAEQGVRQVMVFGNGLSDITRIALDALAQDLEQSHQIKLIVEHAEKNLGPAIAYSRLIQRATADRASIDGILLLDDDNTLSDGCLAKLLQGCDTTSAVCAIRSDRQYMVQAAQKGFMEPPVPGEAFGIDIRKNPRRVLRKILKRRADSAKTGAAVSIPRAPYGGVLVPRAELDQLAAPREDFIIYADDYEYTERLAASGGLSLIPGAIVDDQEQSWNATPGAEKRVSNLVRLAVSKPDFRVYYALRNALVLDRGRAVGPATLWFQINILWLQMSSAIHAAVRGRWQNIRVVGDAIRDAKSETLGLNQKYPLP